MKRAPERGRGGDALQERWTPGKMAVNESMMALAGPEQRETCGENTVGGV